MKLLLKDIAEIRSGYPFRERIEPERDGQFPVIQIKDIAVDEKVSFENLVRVNLSNVRPEYMVHRGDILFISRGGRNQAVFIETEPDNTIFGMQFFAIRPRQAAEPDYLAWYINQKPAQLYFANAAVGTNVKVITKAILGELPVTLPPVEVQRKIVKIYELSLAENRLVEEIQSKRQQLVESALLKMMEEEATENRSLREKL